MDAQILIPCVCPYFRIPSGNRLKSFIHSCLGLFNTAVGNIFSDFVAIQWIPPRFSGLDAEARAGENHCAICYHFPMPVDIETHTTHLPPLKAPHGTDLTCKAWPQEAAMRMLMNNLDDEVGERPRDLVVYGGTGKAARNQQCLEAILASLKALENDETLLVQSGKPVGVFKTHDYAPRVLIANSNLVGHWSNWEKFNELERAGLTMYGQMTAGSWIYIGSQGIIQGTFETFAAAAEKHFGGDLAGKLVVSGGMGGMGGAQPLAATMAGACFLGIDVNPERIKKRLKT